MIVDEKNSPTSPIPPKTLKTKIEDGSGTDATEAVMCPKSRNELSVVSLMYEFEIDHPVINMSPELRKHPAVTTRALMKAFSS